MVTAEGFPPSFPLRIRANPIEPFLSALTVLISAFRDAAAFNPHRSPTEELLLSPFNLKRKGGGELRGRVQPLTTERQSWLPALAARLEPILWPQGSASSAHRPLVHTHRPEPPRQARPAGCAPWPWGDVDHEAART